MQHGIVHIRGHDPRIDLEALPLDEQPFDIARNPDAVHRLLAVEILISRCSKFGSAPRLPMKLKSSPLHHASKD
jgi:hypothetical protein